MSTAVPEKEIDRPASVSELVTDTTGRAMPTVVVDTSRKRRRRIVLACVFAAVAIALFLVILGMLDTVVAPSQPLVFYTVKRADLPITVTERGNLESQKNTEIRCEVENLTYDRSGTSGTQIIYIVPNGTAVKKGDLLVELDSAPLREKLDEQYVVYEQAKAKMIQAQAQYENQITQNKTNLAEAELEKQLAELELQMYIDENHGTYQISRQELELRIQEAKNRIAEALAALAMQQIDRDGIEMLYKLGYRNKGDLEQAMYRYLQAEDNLVAARNALKKAMAEFDKLKSFEYEMQRAKLEGALESAKRKVEQVKRDNKAKLEEAKAAKIAAEREFKKEEEQYNKYKTQLEKCKIYAPHDGMVVYATRGRWGQTVDIQEGAFVRERQKILELPDLKHMQVKLTVHESVLNQVKVGLPAVIKVDAFPDEVYEGTVKSVAVLPNPGGWLSSDIKVYETIVTIDEEVEKLKPGMTAVVEIHIDRLRDVLSVPVQAVVERDKQTWCYVKTKDGDIVKRRVVLGRSNDKFVHVKSGLSEGEQVVLNPMAIIGEEETKKEEELKPDDVSDVLKGVKKTIGKKGYKAKKTAEKNLKETAKERIREAGKRRRPPGGSEAKKGSDNSKGKSRTKTDKNGPKPGAGQRPSEQNERKEAAEKSQIEKGQGGLKHRPAKPEQKANQVAGKA